jgi:hypothetical protein
MIDRTAITLTFQQYPVLLPDAVRVFNVRTTLNLSGLKVTSKFLKHPIITIFVGGANKFAALFEPPRRHKQVCAQNLRRDIKPHCA